VVYFGPPVVYFRPPVVYFRPPVLCFKKGGIDYRFVVQKNPHSEGKASSSAEGFWEGLMRIISYYLLNFVKLAGR
jgi:hypothetical protein